MGSTKLQDGTGSLVIAGCGLHPGHMTLESKSHIESADKVLLVAPNPLSIHHIQTLNPRVENLGRFYDSEKNRAQTYHKMAQYVIEQVRAGFEICVVFYGHPGIFVTSTHLAQQTLDKEGYKVTMLPGISADACLFADLNLDPAFSGCQSYEATQFLLTQRNWDTGAALILWQIGLVGEHTLSKFQPGKQGPEALTQLLLQAYPEQHQVCLYEAPTMPGFQPRKEWLAIPDLKFAEVFPHTTLYIPADKPLEFVKERLAWLGIDESQTNAWRESCD